MKTIIINDKEVKIIRKFYKMIKNGPKIYYEILCIKCSLPKEIAKGNLMVRKAGLSHRRCMKFDRSEKSSVIRFKATSYKNHAKILNLEFALTLEDVEDIIFQDCFYCRRKPNQYYEDFTTPYTGIDRVDNKIGYIIGNCVPSYFICNRAKRNRSKEAFLKWICKIYNKHFNQ